MLLPLRSEWVENNTGAPPIFAEVVLSSKRKNRSYLRMTKIECYVPDRKTQTIDHKCQRERGRERERDNLEAAT